MKTRIVLRIVALGFFTLTAGASDWPQWRGPGRNGISPETGLLKEWPKEGPKLLWQLTDIGSGYSTPAVVGERIYLLSNKGMDNEFAQALDVKDGKQVWATPLGKVGPNVMPNGGRALQYPAARSTPTVDGDLLFALGSDGDLACLETATGSARWRKNLRTEFGGEPGTWAYAESPLIDGDVLVCTPGGKESTLAALNKKSGDVIWKSAIPDGDQAGYASVIVVETGGVKQYVQFLQKGVVGIDAKTGKFLWRYDKTAKNPANIPTPVAHGDLVFSGGGRSGSGLFKLKAKDGAVEAEPVYFSPKLPNAIGGTVQLGEYLYGTNAHGLMCLEFATGNIKWQDKSVGTGSICYADGCLYVHGENNGQVALVEATPDAYREKGRFLPPNPPERGNSKAWAYPVVANGRLYIRDLGSLWCYDIKL
jgi:outer membrane protein assembly factor BamB